ncbi:MAG: SHOCT-like domain-containing protein [Chloroflexota bacterium]
MATEEQTRILQMVANGQVSPVEASDLLSALEPPTPRPTPVPVFPPASTLGPRGRTSRSLIIQVMDGERSKVNVRIPLGLARAAERFLPRQAQQYLREQGIELGEMLDSVQGNEEPTSLLEVDDDDTHVRIAIE